VLVATIGPPARAEIDAVQVTKAIDRGIAYLKREQSPRGDWMDRTGQPGGVTALCTPALLTAGVTPNDPAIQKALENVRKIPAKATYAVSLQTMVLCAAEPNKDLNLILRNAKWLEETQIKRGERNGSWSYPGAM